MKKLIEYKNIILIAILVIVGIVAIIFGNTIAIQGGISGASWGLALLIVSYIAKQKNQIEEINFENTANEIARDIAENGANSEYFTSYNVVILNKMRSKMLKRHKKQFISCFAFAIALFMLAILCIV